MIRKKIMTPNVIDDFLCLINNALATKKLKHKKNSPCGINSQDNSRKYSAGKYTESLNGLKPPVDSVDQPAGIRNTATKYISFINIFIE